MKELDKLLEELIDRIDRVDERVFQIMQYINGECVKKREIRYIFIVLHIIVGLLVYLIFKGGI